MEDVIGNWTGSIELAVKQGPGAVVNWPISSVAARTERQV